MKTIWKLCLLPSLLLMFLSNNGMAADKIPVFVSILPQKYFVQQIGQDLVDVKVMVQPGASPATYEPKPRQMADLSKSKIYFAIGVPYEKAWLDKIAAANAKMRIVHTDQGIEKLAMVAHHHHEEEGHHEDEHHEEGHHEVGHHKDGHHEGEHHKDGYHEDEHHKDAHHEDEHYKDGHHDEAAKGDDHHEHEGLDPHIWLSPALVKKKGQLYTVRTAGG